MKNIRSEIKTHSERIPFFIVLLSAMFYFCAATEIYFYWFKLIQNIGEVSLLFCFFMWLHSEKWGVIAKKSINTLMALNILNIANEYFEINNYYFYYITLIYCYFITVVIYSKCKNT